MLSTNNTINIHFKEADILQVFTKEQKIELLNHLKSLPLITKEYLELDKNDKTIIKNYEEYFENIIPMKTEKGLNLILTQKNDLKQIIEFHDGRRTERIHNIIHHNRIEEGLLYMYEIAIPNQGGSKFIGKNGGRFNRIKNYCININQKTVGAFKIKKDAEIAYEQIRHGEYKNLLINKISGAELIHDYRGKYILTIEGNKFDNIGTILDIIKQNNKWVLLQDKEASAQPSITLDNGKSVFVKGIEKYYILDDIINHKDHNCNTIIIVTTSKTNKRYVFRQGKLYKTKTEKIEMEIVENNNIKCIKNLIIYNHEPYLIGFGSEEWSNNLEEINKDEEVRLNREE